jgi:hypothetical protein
MPFIVTCPRAARETAHYYGRGPLLLNGWRPMTSMIFLATVIDCKAQILR